MNLRGRISTITWISHLKIPPIPMILVDGFYWSEHKIEVEVNFVSLDQVSGSTEAYDLCKRCQIGTQTQYRHYPSHYNLPNLHYPKKLENTGICTEAGPIQDQNPDKE